MKKMLAVLLVAVPLFASDAPKWEDTPEAYFMTAEERSEWQRAKTPEDEARFIAAFHARRDADFSSEIQKRAKVVDERLPLGETKTSATLRGKVVILLGAPAEVKSKYIPKAQASVSHPLESRKGGSTDGAPRANVIGSASGWVEYTFRYAPNPALGIGPEGWSVVIEANGASGKDRLKNPRDKKKLNEILDAAARTSLKQ